jgi:hypothetical protein
MFLRYIRGRDFVVGLATRYELDDPDFKPVGYDFSSCFSISIQTGPAAYSASYKMGTKAVPWGKVAGGER